MGHFDTVMKLLKSCRLTLLFDYKESVNGHDFAVSVLSEFDNAKRIVGALSSEGIDEQLSVYSEIPDIILIDGFNDLYNKIFLETRLENSENQSEAALNSLAFRRLRVEFVKLIALTEKYDTSFLIYFTANRPSELRSMYFRIPEQYKDKVNFMLYEKRYKPATTEVLNGAKLSFEFGKDAFDYILIDYDECTKQYKETGLD